MSNGKWAKQQKKTTQKHEDLKTVLILMACTIMYDRDDQKPSLLDLITTSDEKDIELITATDSHPGKLIMCCCILTLHDLSISKQLQNGFQGQFYRI